MQPTQKKLLEYIIRNEVKLAMENHRLELHELNMKKTFIQPFTDIWDTAKAGVMKTAQTVASTVGSLAKQSVMALLPYLPGITDAGAMKAVSQKHKQNLQAKLDKIDSRYSEVFKRNWDAIANSDIGPLLFLANPQLALGAGLFAKGAGVTREGAITTIQMVDSLVGGSKVLQSALGKLQNLRSPLPGRDGGADVDMSSSGGSGYDDYGALEEQVTNPANTNKPANATPAAKEPDYRKYVEELLKNPEVQAALKNSPAVAAMQQTAVDAILENVSGLLNFSFEDLKKNAGPQYKAIMDQYKKIPGNENKDINADKQFQDTVVADLKKVIKTKAVDQLNALVQQNASLGPTVKNAIVLVQKL